MSSREAQDAAAAPCTLSHDRRDTLAGARPTPGCADCEQRRGKLERIECLKIENAGAHQALGLLDDEEN